MAKLKISYASETPEDYAKALNAAETLPALLSAITVYREVAADAYQQAADLDEAGFVAFRNALKKERRGVFSGGKAAKRFGSIMMPEVMMKVSIVAGQFQVPWGCAYIRLRQVGRVKILNGAAQFMEPPS